MKDIDPDLLPDPDTEVGVSGEIGRKSRNRCPDLQHEVVQLQLVLGRRRLRRPHRAQPRLCVDPAGRGPGLSLRRLNLLLRAGAHQHHRRKRESQNLRQERAGQKRIGLCDSRVSFEEI